MIKIKICGITRIEDALCAVESGADAIGFVFYPRSPRYITPEKAKEIISSIPPFITTVGVFVNEKMDTLIDMASYTGIDIVQLHGDEPPEYCHSLGRRFIKAFRIKENFDIEKIGQYKQASAFLLDTYHTESPGGTGKVFDWNRAIEAKKYGKIILAGGLNPENVAGAIKKVNPYGVDVSSGVETGVKGIKDHDKIRAFIKVVRSIE